MIVGRRYLCGGEFLVRYKEDKHKKTFPYKSYRLLRCKKRSL